MHSIRRVPLATGADDLRRVRRRIHRGGHLGESLLTRAPFEYRDGKLFCEDISAEQLVAEWGTPLYVYSRNAILDRFREFDRAFASVDHMIAYSVKANGNLSILQLLAAEGSGADIVSGGELERALRAGVPADRIVFSGVGKTVVELAAALRAGIYAFNVESEGELRALSDLATTMWTRAPIALRVNPDVESPTPHAYTRTGHSTTKFGIPYEDALRLYRLAASLPGIRVRGIDVHIGSQILERKPYALALQRIFDLIGALEREGIQLEYIDAGGGFGVSYDEEDGPSASDFAEAIVPLVQGSGLRLLLEPGRYIIGPTALLLARVLYIKNMGGKTFIITDAGMNDLLRPSHYASYHAVTPAEQHPERSPQRVDVVGPICESGDFLALDRDIEEIRTGELVAVHTVGAYGFSMASQYNARTRPAEILVDRNLARVIRTRETFDDLVRGEVEHLE